MRMVIAGGGSGGHLFPGIAVAEEFLAREAGNEVLFVGTRRGIEARIVPHLGYPLKTIVARPLAGMGWVPAILACGAVPVGVAQSVWVLLGFRPRVVVGVGGYASGPAMVAAWLLRLPTMIVEVNVAPGLTTRMLGRFVGVVATAFTQTACAFPAGKCLHVGSPLRRQMLEGGERSEPRPGVVPFTLFIFGGSQGARAINTAIVQALPHLTHLRGRLRIVHQTGEKDVEMVRDGYAGNGFSAEVHSFIEDMARHYREADLVIARAGAMTVAELTAFGKPAILVPYPYAAGGHQVLNARALQRAGAVDVLPQAELTGEGLAARIALYVTDAERLRAMAGRSRQLARPDAAKRCVDLAYALAVGQGMALGVTKCGADARG